MNQTSTPPELEERFLPPKHWKTNKFYNEDTGHHIHYASLTKNENTKNLFILPGLSEFTEKYVETASFFYKKGFNVFIIDWAYQGRSTRFNKNREKRHSDGYNSDISDLKIFIDNNSKNSLPNFILAHSMGAHIGIRYLCENSHSIAATSFSAPMINIKSLSPFKSIYSLLINILKPFSNLYVPGGKNWLDKDRYEESILSNDPIRKNIHYEWSLHDQELRLGNPTNKWLIESMRSIKLLINKINIPCFVAIADEEELVCNKSIINFFKNTPNTKILELTHAKHEILMETDPVRNLFLEETLSLFKKSA